MPTNVITTNSQRKDDDLTWVVSASKMEELLEILRTNGDNYLDQSELTKLGLMLTATDESDVDRIDSIVDELCEIAYRNRTPEAEPKLGF